MNRALTQPASQSFDSGGRDLPRDVRRAQASEVPQLVAIATSTGMFTPNEVVELESQLSRLDYQDLADDESIVLLFDEGSGPEGFAYFGADPICVGTWGIFWTAVARASQSRGIGRRLMEAAEDLAWRRGGRMILIETGSKPAYAPTLRFYESVGYVLEARNQDYYAPGDDRLFYRKDAP
jgi:GNAT superfamily N-acetyltransferase